MNSVATWLILGGLGGGLVALGCTTPIRPTEDDVPLDARADAPRLDAPTLDASEDAGCCGLDADTRLDGGRDASDAGRLDTPPPDAGMPDGGPALPPLTTGSGAAPNLTCLGSATAPNMPAPELASFRLRTIVESTLMTSTPFQVFADNVVAPTCAFGCAALVSDTLGRASTNLSGLWAAYRIPANPLSLESVGINEPTAGGRVGLLSALSVATRDSLHMAYGVPRRASTASVRGTMRDCAGLLLRGVVLRLRDGDTELLPGATDGFVGFFSTSVMPVIAPHTEVNGIFFAGNISAAAPTIVIEAYGVPGVGMPLTRLACEELPVVADGASFVDLGPLRGDYPLGHLCR